MRRPGLRPEAALRPWAMWILLVLGTLAGVSEGAGQELLGRVIDRNTGQPIAEVEIRALRGNAEVARTTSNEVGGFRLVLPGGGRFWLEASRMDYVQIDTVSVEVPPDGRRVVEFLLDPRPITLDEIRAEVRRGVPARFLDTYEGFVTRHETLPPLGSRRVVRRGDPEIEGSGTVAEVLLWFPPPRPNTRWFLDGRPSTEEEIEGLIYADVEGVEFYRSHIDAPVFIDAGPTAFVSVVMVWRRRGPG